jgi:hypothetical protein
MQESLITEKGESEVQSKKNIGIVNSDTFRENALMHSSMTLLRGYQQVLKTI